MTVKNAGGTTVAKGSFPATSVPDPNPRVTLTEDLYETFDLPGTPPGSGGGRRLVGRAGTQMTAKARDGLYPTATIASVAPATGDDAGGTAVVITGTNLTGATGVTFGGAAGTSFSVVSPTRINVTTPAHAAGVVDVVVADDAGNATKTGGFTYTA